MQRCVLLAVIALAVFALCKNETSPTNPGKKVRPNECCVISKGFAPSTMKTAFKKCFDKYPKAKPVGPPGNGTYPGGPPPQPSVEVKNARACVAECVFSEEGLLTADKELNKTAVTDYFANSPTSGDLSAARSAAVEMCLETYKADVDSSLDCKSGANELHKCVNRQVFLNCPKTMWTDSAKCEDLKAKVTANKNIPIFFRGPKRGTKEAPKSG